MSYTHEQVRAALEGAAGYLPAPSIERAAILRWLAENYAGMAEDAELYRLLRKHDVLAWRRDGDRRAIFEAATGKDLDAALKAARKIKQDGWGNE